MCQHLDPNYRGRNWLPPKQGKWVSPRGLSCRLLCRLCLCGGLSWPLSSVTRKQAPGIVTGLGREAWGMGGRRRRGRGRVGRTWGDETDDFATDVVEVS